MWRGRFIRAIPKILEDYPNVRFVFLTLTVRNCQIEQLKETLVWMNSSWKRLTERKDFPPIGWVKAVEVTRNNDPKSEWFNTAHPHFHVVMMVQPGYFSGKNYLSEERWAELWMDCLRVNYLPSLKVRAIKSEDKLVRAIVETLKYGVKDSDLVSLDMWLLSLARQLHNTRTVSVGGVMRKYLSEKEPENLVSETEELNPKDDPLIYFDWQELRKRYAKRKEQDMVLTQKQN